MRFLVAVALLVLAVAKAHHTPEHTLRGPRFSVGRLHVYDVELNVTAGIQGLSDQVSKSAIKAELHIYAKSEKDHILKLTKVYTSGSLKAVEGPYDYVPLEKNNDLEDRLSTPIKFRMENGEVTSYTLSPRESMESRKIKKSILRSLEMYVPDSAHEQLESSSRMKIPVIYNVTLKSGPEVHTTHYLITVSPDVEYPYHSNVYNISRSEGFEGERYPSHKFHHNFAYVGCPDVCRMEWANNEYGAGCPVGYEPHQSPLKTYVHHQHHLTLENGVMTPEIIENTEVHVAKMYDQDMTVLIEQYIRKTGSSRKTMEEPSGRTYTDLHDQESEINTEEIEEQCGYRSSREAMRAARTLLEEIARIIVKGDLEDRESTIIGEKIILLKKALAKLKVSELQTMAGTIKRLGSLSSASEEEKVKRQVWMDILPVIGTENAVTFIVSYIKENVGRELLVWEAKEMLEALPQNIHAPSEKNINDLRTLLTLSKVRSSHLLHSAVYSCLGKVIGDMCNGTETETSSWHVRRPVLKQPKSSSPYESEECPERLVSEIMKEITDKLRSTKSKGEMIIYLDTLAHIGDPEVLPIISEYAYGIAENIQDFSPSTYEFIKTASVFSLHKMAKKHPERVLETVKPLFFNETEIPKLRNAAFGVMIRCQPPLEVLQHVAVLSWKEKSNEVGSFVTSTLDTFGNSSLPCMLLTARRIKQIMPMVNRFDIGAQHAKNLIWSYFDDVRELGVKGHLSYTPSNESAIPAAIYHALSYSTDSLTDVIIQNSLHIQGLTHRHIVEYIDKSILGIQTPESFSSSKEREIFGEAKIAERIPDEMRLTIYRRMFYSSSFYYLDLENLKPQIDTLREYLKAYLTQTSYDYSGHLVKVYLPSTFHTETIAKTLPYPVEFQMLQPVVLALKIKSMERNPSIANFHFHVRPSVYLSKLFINQLKNVGDCKEVGVYHEHKIAISYPLEIKFRVKGMTNITVSYKVPELPKRILYYFTESGTYAGKKSFQTLPSSENREPIRTLPSPFQYSPEVNVIGLPPVQIDMHLEDIDLLSEVTPRTPLEFLDIAVRRILNAGWRYKAANITIRDDSSVWPRDTEVTFNVQYNRTHVVDETHKMDSMQDSKQDSWSTRQDSSWSKKQDSHWPARQDSHWPARQDSHWPARQDSPSKQDQPWSERQDSQWSWKQSPQWISETETYPTEDYMTTEPDDNEPSTEDSPKSWWWKKDRKDEHKNNDVMDDEDWSKDMLPSETSRNKEPSTLTDRARKQCDKLSRTYSHITHNLNVEIETRPVHSNAYFRVEYNHTYTKSLHSLRVDTAIKTPMERVPRKLTIVHLMGFFLKPDEFEYDSHHEMQKAAFITGILSPPDECEDPWKYVSLVAGGFLHYSPLENAMNDQLQNKIDIKHFLSAKHEACMQDVKEGKSMSINCLKAHRERSIYNKLKMGILFKDDTPDDIVNLGRRLDTFLKHHYYKHMTVKYEKNYDNIIYINLKHIDKLADRPVFNATIYKPGETIELRRVKTFESSLDEPISSIHDLLGVDLMELTNNTYPPTCVMMKKYVRTFDLKEYPINLDRCSYVLSAHCSDYKNFAIIAKILSTEEDKKEIHIHVGSHSLVLTPSSDESDYTIKHNDREYTVTNPLVFDEDGAEIYVYPENFYTHKHLLVEAKKAGIKVTYDGMNVKVEIDPRYKGETCGLCSEFDGEIMREFRGVDRCLYSHPDDFVNSAITNRDTCKKQPRYPYQCENDDSDSMDWRRGGDDSDNEYVPNTKRNFIVVKGSEICFSVHPVPVCEDNVHPIETKSESVGFHCLPKQDVTARRMVQEAKRRSLGEIENKSVDYEDIVEVAKMCAHNN